MSISGGFIETELKIPVLSTLCLTVLDTSCSDARVVHAISVRSDSEGVGVEWFDGDSDVVAALMQEAPSDFRRHSCEPSNTYFWR
jgi:hypothetical protein